MNPSRFLFVALVCPVVVVETFSAVTAADAPLPPAFVQQNYLSPQSPQIKISVPYLQTQAASNGNVLAIGWNDTFAALASVMDSAGNTYQTAVPTFQANGMSQAIYYATGIRAGANTVSVTFNQPAAFVDLRITEYSGLRANGFDAGSSEAGSGSNADSGPVSVSTTNELIFGAGMTATAFIAEGAGFNLRAITVPDGDIIEDQIANGSGLYHAPATLDSGAWLMQVAAFKPLAPAAPPLLNIMLTSTNTLLVSWPAASSGFGLQRTFQLGAPIWANVTNPVEVVGGQNQVVVPLSSGQQYFRLKSP